MNLEIASRLQKLRREKGYSQEELADKLGVSRQAVSKWERAESSPDTDNLIVLAKLYGRSLDELLLNSSEDDELEYNTINDEDTKIESESSDDNEKEIKVITKAKTNYTSDGETNKKSTRVILGSVLTFVTLIAFLLWGLLFNGWRIAWILWLVLPFVLSIVDAVNRKKVKRVVYPLFTVIVFMVVGLVFGIWNPTWIVFLTIPIFYTIADAIDRKNKQ